MKLLEGKVALITGGSRGIGLATALLFAEHGCHIAFTYRQARENGMTDIEQQIARYGVQVKSFCSDAADFDATQSLVNDVVKQFGRLDILVNNAGITRDTLVMRMTEQQWDEVMDTNLKSAFSYIHAVSPIMMRQRSGSIISLSSYVGLNGNAGQANYSASKAGVIALTKSAAKELGARGIRVNCIAPGLIQTDMTSTLPEQLVEEYARLIPLKRMGTAEEVAKVALFLASDLASYVSGEVVQVNGAMA